MYTHNQQPDAVQVPWRILTREANVNCASEGKLSSPLQTVPHSGLVLIQIHVRQSAFLCLLVLGRRGSPLTPQPKASVIVGCHTSCSEHSDKDFHYLCIWAVDALESLDWCLRLLRGVYSGDKISRLDKQFWYAKANARATLAICCTQPCFISINSTSLVCPDPGSGYTSNSWLNRIKIKGQWFVWRWLGVKQ